MDIKIIIKRQKDSRSAPYTQEFTYTGDGRLTVADFLSELNTRMPLLTADGKETEKINYASSCQEKKCGACAMLINGPSPSGMLPLPLQYREERKNRTGAPFQIPRHQRSSRRSGKNFCPAERNAGLAF